MFLGASRFADYKNPCAASLRPTERHNSIHNLWLFETMRALAGTLLRLEAPEEYLRNVTYIMELRNRLLKQYIAENIFRTTDDGPTTDEKTSDEKNSDEKNSDEKIRTKKKIGGKARGQGTAAAEARHG